MIIYPAIDLYAGQAVRLYKGDYSKMNVYNKEPLNTVRAFKKAGADHLHLVDLEGAKSGETVNLATISGICSEAEMFVELGGGIRTLDTIEKYISLGVDRTIIGTAAVTNAGFAEDAVKRFGDHIAVGVDILDGFVAVKGWTEKTRIGFREFCKNLSDIGVSTVICTDISRDGAMRGTNLELYRELSEAFSMDIIASGGVSSMDDVRALAKLGLHGAIIGKAYYTGAIDLSEAIKLAKGDSE